MPFEANPDTTIAYELDPTHTTVAFRVRHMMVTWQRGRFRTVRGHLWLDREDPTRSRIEAEIDVASIDTDVAARDEHLRSADFFDATNHPTMRFTSTRITALEDRLRVEGELEIRGIRRPTVLDTDTISPESLDPFGMLKVGTSARTTLSRKDYGLVWNAVLETGGVAVGDTVHVELDLQFQRKP
ncbi:MAG: YceI family protein [Sandaracinus sp.]|nr:YceI family protein [Sandaracinus sp.]